MTNIRLKSQEEIRILREGGKILHDILYRISTLVKPGISTGELNYATEKFLQNYPGAEAAFKGYRGFPASICTSVNEACVHGIPSSKYILKPGDIIGLDFGIRYKNLITDSAITVPVGEIDLEVKHFVKTTKEALDAAIRVAVMGNHLGMISSMIQKTVERQGYNCTRDLIGHGVGYEVHEPPDVPNVGRKNDGPLLKEGMVIAIEPITTMKDWKVKCLKDRWTMVTADGSWSAHFEHTVAITKNGPEVLTKE